MEMLKASLEQLLATIPSQTPLDQNVSDVHLAEIAKELTSWNSICMYLGISVPEEVAFEQNYRTAARQRYVVLLSFVEVLCRLIYLRRAFSERELEYIVLIVAKSESL